MKKHLLTFAAALAIGAGAFSASAAMQTGTVCQSTDEQGRAPVYTYWSYSASQSLYPASALAEATDNVGTFTIEKVSFPVVSAMPSSGTATMTLYLAVYDGFNLISPLSTSDFTKVATVTYDWSNLYDDPNYDPFDPAITFNLDEYFVVKEGEYLVVGVEYAGNNTDDLIKFQECRVVPGAVYQMRYASGNDPIPVSLEGAYALDEGYVPGMKIGWEPGEVTKPAPGGDDKTAQVTEGATWDSYLPFNGGSNNAGSQVLFPASVMDKAVNGASEYTIKEIELPLGKFSDDYGNPTAGKFKVSVSFAKTSLTSLSQDIATVPEAEFTEVYNGTIDLSKDIQNDAVTLAIEPYTLAAGEGLVVMTQSERIDKVQGGAFGMLLWQKTVEGEDCMAYYYTASSKVESDKWTDNDIMNPQAVKYSFAMSIKYTEGEVEPQEVIDLAAAGLGAPDGEIYTDKPYEFTVALNNNGTVVASEYTVEVVNTADDTVLASVANPVNVYPGVPGFAKIELSFAEAGTYSLAARVVMEGDENADNNQSEAIELTVLSLAYKAVEVSGDAAPALGVEQTYTVTVANQGSAELTGYNVDLYLVRAGMADVLLGTVAETPAIAAGESAAIEFKHTFELGGEFGLKGVVTLGEGEPSETPVFDVVVEIEKLSPVISAQIPQWNGSTEVYDYYFFGDYDSDMKYKASQMLFTADYFGDHKNAYQIQSLAFRFIKGWDYPATAPVRIYLAQTDRTAPYESAEELVPEEDFVLVYDGAVEINSTVEDLVFDLQRTFTLENGKSLAVNLIVEGHVYCGYIAGENTGEEYYALYASTNANEPEFSLYNASRVRRCNYLPSVTFGYALEPLPANIDLAATSLVAPTEDLNTDTDLRFRVNLENMGTVEIEEYSIELLNVDENGESTVLDTYEGTRYIATEQTTFQNVTYSFATPGTYNIAARVVVEGDTDESNNITAPVTVVISDKSGVENVLAEGTLSYDAAARVLNVNLGACALTVSDLAGRTVAVYELDGATRLPLNLTSGVYVVSAEGKTLKIRI